MLTALSLVSACGADSVPERVQSKRAAILHGAEIDDDAHRAVVSLGGLTGCTGTFITQHLVVSGAHCLPCWPNMPAHARSLVVVAGVAAAGQQASVWRWVNQSWRVERTTVEAQ
jgi:V8-like Glu-specific endopeptidase